jgi:hypothetical protein
MTQNYEQISERLGQLEQQALETPEQLFALSYVRSHLDLLDPEQIDSSITEALLLAVENTFDADRMSEQDRTDVVAIIRSLASR